MIVECANIQIFLPLIWRESPIVFNYCVQFTCVVFDRLNTLLITDFNFVLSVGDLVAVHFSRSSLTRYQRLQFVPHRY